MTPSGTEIFRILSYFYILIYFIYLYVKLMYRRWMMDGPLLPTVLCCPPVAAPVTAPLRPGAIRFPGDLSARTVVAKQDIHHHQACPLPSQRPELMNHQRTFHGVHFILIKRSRLLFFCAALSQPETNGVSEMLFTTFLLPAGRMDPGNSLG